MPGVTGKIGGAEKKLQKIRDDSNAQTDPLRNPDGVYSGPSKRNAIQSGVFAEVSNMPRESMEQPLRRRSK